VSLTLDQKKNIVAEVSVVAAEALSVVAAEYRGLSVEQMTELRANARNEGVYLRVVKNSLARKAVEGTEFECLKEALIGPLILAFSREDPGSAARVIDKFSKENEQLVVKLIALGGKLLDAKDIKAVANLPTRDQAISMLMSVMMAPVEKLTRCLNDVPSQVVRVVAAVKDQKS